jgi:hypothetical protein
MDSKTMVHEIGTQPKPFDTLHAALGYCSDRHFTGYLVTPTNDIINIRKGKRKDVNGKWISVRTEVVS